MAESNTLLAIFAHPDDEALVAGGTLARYAAEGWRTALLCATRGEWGPISDEALADYENLGEVREREVRAACEVLGISWLRFLELDDGGVAAVLDTAEEAQTLEKIVRALRELRPQIVITFGPDGLYGHSDHVAIGQLAAKACALAADPNVFPQHLSENLPAQRVAELHYATAPQGFYAGLLSGLAATGQAAHLWGIPPEQFGVPAEEIDLTCDITPYLERKLAALRCHRTQLDDSHAFARLTIELATQLFSREFFRRLLLAFLLIACTSPASKAQEARLTLDTLVMPATSLYRDGQPVKFALYGLLEFQTLAELFVYIDAQAGRWQFASAAEHEEFADRLLQRGVQSRLISMVDERPLELLQTHTAAELAQAVARVRTPAAPFIFQGRHWRLTPGKYAEKFLKTQARWRGALNCWSASPVIAGRVLSNFYLIEEGIPLFGASYDSTEHFWQAVKYHPDVRLHDLLTLLDRLETVDWAAWLAQLEREQRVYLAHTHAIEFLRHNLTRAQLDWFRRELSQSAVTGQERVRELQQRDAARLRFTALQEKILWGNLADLFHLLYYFATLEAGRFCTAELTPLLAALVEFHFDGVYLAGYGPGKFAFISRDFQQLMLEIWRVKFLRLKRFGAVLRTTRGVKLDHYLNDGDAPDIPLTVYVGFLHRIRELALAQAA